jgi:hypothetical protein
MSESTAILYSGSLRPYPGMLLTWTPRQKVAAFHVLDDLKAILGRAPEHEPGADIEDFWEDACRMSAAWRAANAAGTPFAVVAGKTDWTAGELARRLGPVSRDEEGGYHARDPEIMNPDSMHPALRRAVGREVQMLTVEPHDAGGVDVIDWMVGRARTGVTDVVLKNVERKNGIWCVRVSSDRARCRASLYDALEWTAVRLEGVTDSLMGQDLIDMRWEYRCFVVDGQVISAAGCIEEFTPLDAHDPWVSGQKAFDTRLREHRGQLMGEPSPVVDQPEIAERLLSFARTVAADHGGTIVIDCAIDAATDLPIIVEFNGLPNSGLYASDPWAVMEALAGTDKRGYSHRPLSESA